MAMGLQYILVVVTLVSDDDDDDEEEEKGGGNRWSSFYSRNLYNNAPLPLQPWQWC